MKIIRLLYKIFLFSFLTVVLVIIALYAHAYFSKPIDLNTYDSYYLYDSNDTLINDNFSQKNWVSINDISDNLKNAVISVEDKSFYKHNGFDYLRIIKALYSNFSKGKITQGASTISQQYVKNAYLEFDQTWSRKIKEALMTLNIEVHYSKDEILEAYLNTINYGKGCYGIYDASKYYFNKLPSELTLEESIILAGIPKSPTNYNPVNNYDNSIKRAKIVALSMYNNSYINKETYDKLFNNNIEIYGKINEEDLTMLSYYEQYVEQELENIPGITQDVIESGTLKVYTTLNIDNQKTLEKEIKNTLGETDLQVASVIIDPQTGGLLALSGGLNYQDSQYNRALYSKRQVGSSMKPFLYYAALENGMTSSSTFLSQYTTFNLSNGKTYSPKNYNNVYPNSEITMAAAIAYSDNVYAVKTNLFLGVDKMINVAKKAGITEKLKSVPSLALGTSELNMLDFAAGYTTFASGGYKREIHAIRKIEDQDGNVLYEYKEINNLVLNPNYVYILNELLTSPTSTAFLDYNTPTALYISSKLTQKYALKSGTTDTDHWEVGYNSDKLMLLWIGYDDNKDVDVNITLKSKTIWANVMENIKTENINNWYELPKNVVGIPLHSITGKKTNDASKTNIFYYVLGSEPEI